jgi:hypothetical protein
MATYGTPALWWGAAVVVLRDVPTASAKARGAMRAKRLLCLLRKRITMMANKQADWTSLD